jgi:hypothetical protein
VTSTPSDRSRIAVLLPSRRLWPWHRGLIAALGEGHEVSVVVAPSQGYPWLLRAWFALAARLFPGATAPLAAGALAGSGAAERPDLVVDLSEGSAAVPDAPVLRPLYDGSADTMALVGRLLRRQCPMLDVVDADGEAISSSYAAIEDKAVLGRSLAQAFARTGMLVARARAQSAPGRRPSEPPRPPAPFSATLLIRSALRLLAGKAVSRLPRPRSRHDHWNIALRWREAGPDLSRFDLGDYAPLPVDAAVFYADPFVIEEEGRHFLFAEAFPYATGKGVIACAEITRDGPVPPLRTILERPYHLSYPYLVRREGAIFLIPEASESRGLEIYRAQAFPDQWVLERRLFEGLALVDPTLFEHGGRLWLFAGVIGEGGGSAWDELFAWHAPALTGPWTPHRLNPIKSDCRSARPGGRPLRVGGKLLRPAQRCERRYGESLVWLEVTELTPDAFVEMEIALWASPDPRVTGLHSADLATALEAVDFRRPLDN